MWDFSGTKALSMVLRTFPFVLLRLAVYLGVAIAYVMATGFGAMVGFGFGHFGSDPSAPEGGAFWGGLVGFGLASVALYLAREYILYLVKAAHIAVLVELNDGKSVPAGQSQIAFGSDFVKTHFAESSVLFGVDQIVKAVLRIITGTLNAITAFLPIPALRTAMNIFNAVLRISLTYVDEIILAYLIRTRTTNPFDSAKDALILYAQNYKSFLKNAVWLALFMWGLTFAIFVVLVGPFATLLAFFPGQWGALGFGLAFVFAWAIKAAVLEPFAIAALMQAFFKTIEGQTPDPMWEERLSGASKKFRELSQKALAWGSGPAAATGRAPGAS